ncbi:MAG: TraB/GumN family protein [Algicola sp.]|nr:TraB/GumN family protein [Algicola sp.]
MEYTLGRFFNRLFFICICLPLSANSQVEHSKEHDIFNTLLFKVTSNQNSKVSYLFGTHHAFGQSFFDSLTKVNQALKSSDLLIKENLNIPGEMAEDIINRRSNVTKWHKYLNKVDVSFLETLFAKSPTDYNKMTPTEMYSFLNRQYKQQICLNKDKDDISLSLDDYIGFKAQELHLELVGLETTKEQIHLINNDVKGLPRRSHKRRLTNIINKIRSKNVKDCEETNWYTQMQMDYHLNIPCRNALVLTDRNAKWMQTLSQLIATENCFIAVGLSHLMYNCGLINQLNKLGYTVTPIEIK